MDGRNTKHTSIHNKRIIIERTKHYDDKKIGVGGSDKEKKKANIFDDKIYVRFYHTISA